MAQTGTKQYADKTIKEKRLELLHRNLLPAIEAEHYDIGQA